MLWTGRTPNLFQQCARHHYHPGGPISNLVVLAFGELHEQPSYLVLNLHLFQDGGTIVCCAQV